MISKWMNTEVEVKPEKLNGLCILGLQILILISLVSIFINSSVGTTRMMDKEWYVFSTVMSGIFLLVGVVVEVNKWRMSVEMCNAVGMCCTTIKRSARSAMNKYGIKVEREKKNMSMKKMDLGLYEWSVAWGGVWVSHLLNEILFTESRGNNGMIGLLGLYVCHITVKYFLQIRVLQCEIIGGGNGEL